MTDPQAHFSQNFNISIIGPELGSRWIFLHGLMGSAANWRKITSRLENSCRVLTFDQRGHGKSYHPASGYSPRDYAEDLFKIATEQNWSPFVLVGHSMGARNALSYANQYPQTLQGLVLEDMGVDLSIEDADYYENMLNSIPTPFANRAQARDFFQNTFLNIFSIQDDNPTLISQFLYANLYELENGMMDWRFNKSGIIETVKASRLANCWPELQNLKVKTLVLRGKNSRVLTESGYESILNSNSLIEGHTISECGHWIHSEKPKQFYDLIVEFKAKLSQN